jgi:translocation and assembly module TamB
VNGILDLDVADTVDLKVQVPQGRIEDFIQVFSHFVKNLSWFPHSLSGSLNGGIQVTGGISMNQLKVLAQVQGSNWEYLGERFKSVQLSGGYDCGKYLISDFNTIKRFGKLSGDISYSKDDQLEWNISSEGLTLSDLDYIAQLDVPIRGKILLESSGSGRVGSIQSETEIQLNGFSVRGFGMAPSQLTFKTNKGIATAKGSALGKHALLDAQYNFDPREMSYIRTELKHFDFSPVLLLLNTKSIQDQNLAGYVSGKLDLNFHAGKFERSTGVMSLSEYYLSKTNVNFNLENPISVNVSDGSFDIRNLIIRGKTGSVALTLNSQSSQLNGALQGNLDNSIVEFLTPTVIQALGTSALDIHIGGRLKEPLISGRAQLGGGSFRISSLDSTFENVSGSLQLKQNEVSIQNLQADLGGGRIGAHGKILINGDRYPEVNIKLLLNGPRIKVYPFQYAKLNGNIGVHGTELPYVVDGDVVVLSALSKEKVLNQKKTGAGLKSLQYAPPPTKQGESNSYSKFKLNIAVEAPRDIFIQNDLFRDVQAKGSFTIVNTLETPRILGTAEVIQGQLLFKDHVFQIQSATATFDNPTVINPSFNLSANTEVNGIKIQLFASGRIDSNRMKIELASNPAMQEQEILSLLAVGLTSSDAKKLNSSDLNAVQQGEAASLVLHSLDFNRELEDKTGFQVQLDESVNRYQGVSAFRPQSQADAAAAPQITIRRKLGDRFSLSAGSTVGAGTNKANQINLDMSVSPDVSVSGVFNNYGTYGASETQPVQNSLGVDLKFQKRFK